MSTRKQLLEQLNNSLPQGEIDELDIITKIAELISAKTTFNEHYYLGSPKDMKNEFKTSLRVENKKEIDNSTNPNASDVPVKRKLLCTSLSTLAHYLFAKKGIKVSYLLENLDTGTSTQFNTFNELILNIQLNNNDIHICLIIDTNQYGPIKFDLQPCLLDLKLHQYPQDLLSLTSTQTQNTSRLTKDTIINSFKKNGISLTENRPFPLFNNFQSYQEQIQNIQNIITKNHIYLGCSELHKLYSLILSDSVNSKSIKEQDVQLFKSYISNPKKKIHSFFIMCKEKFQSEPTIYIFSHKTNSLEPLSVLEFLYLISKKNMKILDSNINSIRKNFITNDNKSKFETPSVNIEFNSKWDDIFFDTDEEEIEL